MEKSYYEEVEEVLETETAMAEAQRWLEIGHRALAKADLLTAELAFARSEEYQREAGIL